MSSDREREVIAAFVSLANTMVDGFDVIDLLSGLTTDCARLLDVASAGLLLADGSRVLHVVAASSEATRNLELFQLQREQGPCLDCYRMGSPVSAPDLAAKQEVWPQFVDGALGAGFVSVHAVPMRLHDTVLGTLGLFGTEVGSLAAEDLSLAQGLAHVASIAIVAGQVTPDSRSIRAGLQQTLANRVLLEQAKGVLAARGDIELDQAFDLLRRYARDNRIGLADVARSLITRTLSARTVIDHARTSGTTT
ncbi:GAF and ANTAR domain-containing protein [Antrihabitans sp. NCIMB 15449]|uniref:GAF and ANTAR domain-containing protein n=1 Tax=Antrihabitans spumae TaxID=3373370 RepID=A0ABW7JIV7_9NOCA